MELGHVAMGPEAALDFKLEGGAVKIVVSYNGADGSAKLEAGLKPKAFVDKLKGMIPGQVDDMIFDLLLAQLEK